VHDIPLGEEKLGKVGAILAGDTGDLRRVGLGRERKGSRGGRVSQSHRNQVVVRGAGEDARSQA